MTAAAETVTSGRYTLQRCIWVVMMDTSVFYGSLDEAGHSQIP